MRHFATLFALFSLAGVLSAATPNGLWDAAVTLNDVSYPFRFELDTKGANATGVFFDGDQRLPSNQGQWKDGKLHLRWEMYDAEMDAKLDNGALVGTYVSKKSSPTPRNYAFRAARYAPANATAAAPSIAGQWELRPADGSDPKKTWKFFVRQSGPEVSGAILRIDGDTGTLSGTYRDGQFVLSHFSGARPSVIALKLAADGTIDATLNGRTKLTGVRTASARAQGLPEPPDPTRYTTVADPSEPFHFKFPDVSGKSISDQDEQFRGKVTIVTIGGSWCPNCNDEAPLLVELYKKYHSQGLEVVSLQFESGDDEYDRERVQAFVKRYNVPYTVLIAGKTDDVKAKLNFLVNWSAFPTSFYLGRDGRVRSSHAGFASVATGEEHTRLREEITSLIERLLAEKQAITPTAE